MKSKGPQVFFNGSPFDLRQCWARTRKQCWILEGLWWLFVARHHETRPRISGRIFSPRKTELAYPSKRPDRGEGAKKKNAKGPLKFNMEPEIVCCCYTPEVEHGSPENQPWKRGFLLETIILRFHVELGEGMGIFHGTATPRMPPPKKDSQPYSRLLNHHCRLINSDKGTGIGGYLEDHPSQ